MPADRSFDDVMARLRGGDEAAAAEVFHRFAGRLIALARGRLEARLRPKVDAEDVLQSVFKSFFLRHAEGQLRPEGWDGLWSLLTVITLRKCGRWREHFHARRRNVAAEALPDSDPDGPDAAWEALATDPTPEEGLELAEAVERLLAGLEGRDRDIVTLALQGYAADEISARLGRPERTVYRVLARVKKRLQRMRDEGGDGA